MATRAGATGGITSPIAGAGAAGKQQNVQVAVRVRPFNRRERDLGAKCIVDIQDVAAGQAVVLADPAKTSTVTSPGAAGAGGASADGKRTFVYDHAYFWDSKQETVYTDLARPIVDQAMRGYNGTIFAYGQTGSGKTFSMMGDDEYPGIIPQLNRDLFSRIEAMSTSTDTEGPKFLVIVSYLEIYNEVVKDLLNPSDKQLMIREHPEMGIYVQDLAELVVKNADDVAHLLEQGQKVRHVAATNMNERSSRSHSCFSIKIEQKSVETRGDIQKTTTLTAKINLVDLAGSERASKTGATGDVLKQGAAINKSLSALGNVINALAEGKTGHIPYRDSKLTRLLQHSLGGNSLTVMIATISPADDNLEETLSTLQYANRAKNIKNDAKRNEDVNEMLIRQLREEIESLRKALASAQGGTSETSISDAQRAHMEEMIANLERAKQQSWEEKERLSTLYEEERKRNLENESKVRSVMQTIKEDNIELMKRMRTLMNDRTKLTKRFKKLKDQHLATRDALAGEMARYQELYADGGEEGPHRDELEAILENVESLHSQVEAEAEELKSIKDEIADNEQQQMEARSEAAAQRMLLEEDAELRKAIQEEERMKLEKETEALLEAKLAEERQRLKEAAESERAALIAKYADSRVGDREQELELALVQANGEKSMLSLELTQIRSKHAMEMKQQQQAFRNAMHELKVEQLRMFREMVDGFEEERAALEAKLADSHKLLQAAVQDLTAMTTRNRELERALAAAAAWEPPVM